MKPGDLVCLNRSGANYYEGKNSQLYTRDIIHGDTCFSDMNFYALQQHVGLLLEIIGPSTCKVLFGAKVFTVDYFHLTEP